MSEEPHRFQSGEHQLFGILHRAEDEKGLILLLHGFTGNHTGNKYSFVTLARELCDRGYNVFRFDYGGSGDSEGDFADQRLETCTADVKNALEYLEHQGVETSEIGLLGHSMGGSVALLTASEVEADVLVTWSTIAAYRDLWSEEYNNILQKQDNVTFYGFKFPAEKLTELLEYDLESAAAALAVPTMFVHGKKDESVPYTHSERLYDAASEPKNLLLLKDSDHIFTNPVKRQKLIQETADWFDTHL